jgi:NO-binding membrane sensor protein with MHYT domain
MAGVAIADHHTWHCGGNMDRRFAVCRRVGTGVACCALGGHHFLGMVPFGGRPGCGAVADQTVAGGGNVGTGFTGRATAVVAACTLCSRGVQAVVGLGGTPAAGGLVAGLAISGDCGMDGCCRLACYSIRRTQVASRALRRYRHVAVKAPWIPCGKATAVTSIAIADHHTGNGGGNMHRRFAVRWRVGTCVACCALGGHHFLGMVPFGGRPGCGAVADQTVAGGGNVGTGLPSCATAVMAVCTLRRRGEQAVVGFGGTPAAGGLVAGLAVSGHCRVNRCRRFTGDTKSRVQVAGCALCRDRHIAVEPARVPGSIATAVAGVAIADHHTGDGGGNMDRRFAIRRRVGTCVACAAFTGDHLLGMVPLGGLPCVDCMAAGAVANGWKVVGQLASSSTAIVATAAIGGGIEKPMVRFGRGPARRRLVARLAVASYRSVDGGRRFTRNTVPGC